MQYPQSSFGSVVFDQNSFWSRKRDVLSTVALPYQLGVLKETGRYDAFQLKWHPIYNEEPEIWPIPKHQFWDSDVAKWIEGACYFLQDRDLPEIRAAVDELVNMISSAQQSDGYLNIHFTVVEPEKRFTNLRDLHELYNAGHLIEAAIAHENLYKNGALLKPIVKYVDYLSTVFGPSEDQIHGYPGHPEIELALLRLFELTEKEQHRKLAEYFLTERGNPTGVDGEHFYDVEARKRGESQKPDYFPEPRSYWYQQAHVPILQQKTIEGHSVRAMYLLTALADLVRLSGDEIDKGYTTALNRLWKNTVRQKMYATGGIGAIRQWEGFSHDHFLPQSTDEGGCYAETCASIGLMMLADRMIRIHQSSHYADIAELCLYNSILTGVSCNGKEWTYVNQLASSDLDLSGRSSWFTVSCCPPNVVRLLGSLGGYLAQGIPDVDKKRLAISLYHYSSAEMNWEVAGANIKLHTKTDWPLDGKVEVRLECGTDSPEVAIELALRIPEWAAHNWEITPASTQSCSQPHIVKDGFLYLDNAFLKQNPKFVVDFPMKPRLVKPHPLTGQHTAAIARGPLIYCVEDVDNTWVKDHFKSTYLDLQRLELAEKRVKDAVTGEDIVKIHARAGAKLLNLADRDSWQGPCYPALEPLVERELPDLCFIPYYFRANRGGNGQMRTGIKIIPTLSF